MVPSVALLNDNLDTNTEVADCINYYTFDDQIDESGGDCDRNEKEHESLQLQLQHLDELSISTRNIAKFLSAPATSHFNESVEVYLEEASLILSLFDRRMSRVDKMGEDVTAAMFIIANQLQLSTYLHGDRVMLESMTSIITAVNSCRLWLLRCLAEKNGVERGSALHDSAVMPQLKPPAPLLRSFVTPQDDSTLDSPSIPIPLPRTTLERDNNGRPSPAPFRDLESTIQVVLGDFIRECFFLCSLLDTSYFDSQIIAKSTLIILNALRIVLPVLTGIDKTEKETIVEFISFIKQTHFDQQIQNDEVVVAELKVKVKRMLLLVKTHMKHFRRSFSENNLPTLERPLTTQHGVDDVESADRQWMGKPVAPKRKLRPTLTSHETDLPLSTVVSNTPTFSHPSFDSTHPPYKAKHCASHGEAKNGSNPDLRYTNTNFITTSSMLLMAKEAINHSTLALKKSPPSSGDANGRRVHGNGFDKLAGKVSPLSSIHASSESLGTFQYPEVNSASLSSNRSTLTRAHCPPVVLPLTLIAVELLPAASSLFDSADHSVLPQCDFERRNVVVSIEVGNIPNMPQFTSRMIEVSGVELSQMRDAVTLYCPTAEIPPLPLELLATPLHSEKDPSSSDLHLVEFMLACHEFLVFLGEETMLLKSMIFAQFLANGAKGSFRSHF